MSYFFVFSLRLSDLYIVGVSLEVCPLVEWQSSQILKSVGFIVQREGMSFITVCDCSQFLAAGADFAF